MLRIVVVVVLLLLPVVSWSGAPSKKQRAQQARMSACSAEAKAQLLAGEGRRNWMKACLSGHTPAGGGPVLVDPKPPVSTEPPPLPSRDGRQAKPVETPQQRMARCQGALAKKALQGTARQAWLDDCLRSK